MVSCNQLYQFVAVAAFRIVYKTKNYHQLVDPFELPTGRTVETRGKSISLPTVFQERLTLLGRFTKWLKWSELMMIFCFATNNKIQEQATTTITRAPTVVCREKERYGKNDTHLQ